MLFPLFASAEAPTESDPQILVTAALVDRCRPAAPAELVADPSGPSIALLSRAAGYVPGVTVESHPYFLTVPGHGPGLFEISSGAGGFRLEFDASPTDSAIGLHVSFERFDAAGHVVSNMAHQWLASDDTIFAMPAGPAPSRGCPDGDAILYVSVRSIASAEDLATFGTTQDADIRRHFEGLGSAQRRHRAEALLATSPVAALLVP